MNQLKATTIEDKSDEIDFEKFIHLIRSESFYVYGIGKVAERFVRYLEREKLLTHIMGFIVSLPQSKMEPFHGRKVYSIQEVDCNSLILIATDVTSKDEIEEILNVLRFKKYIWIYWMLYDLFLGPPVRFDALVMVNKVFKGSIQANWIATCYCVIEDYFGKNNYGRDLYVSFAKMFFSEAAARKDLKRFWERIAECAIRGFQQDYNIKINKEHTLVLDGAHRIALASFFQINQLRADIYECNTQKYQDLYGVDGFVSRSDDNILSSYLTYKEFQLIKKVFDRI